MLYNSTCTMFLNNPGWIRESIINMLVFVEFNNVLKNDMT